MAQVITFIIFGGFGLMMLYVGVTQFRQQRRLLRNAQPVEAVITHSQVHSSTSSELRRGSAGVNATRSTTTHRPDLRFSYSFAGVPYESDLLRPTIIVRSYASRSAAAEELAPFPVNARVTAHLDPIHPDKAFLLAERSHGPLIFTIIGFVLPPAAWIVGGLL